MTAEDALGDGVGAAATSVTRDAACGSSFKRRAARFLLLFSDEVRLDYIFFFFFPIQEHSLDK